MTDDNFQKRRDRGRNDIHIFFELQNGCYFQLRAYTQHMLQVNGTSSERVFLTGYLKPQISPVGGVHSFRQDWYLWDAKEIADEIIKQNPALFSADSEQNQSLGPISQ